MCTSGRANLEKVGKELDGVYAELRQINRELIQAKKEKEAAEAESRRCADRCMRLTKNADIANLWMMIGTATSFVLLGLVVYGL